MRIGRLLRGAIPRTCFAKRLSSFVNLPTKPRKKSSYPKSTRERSIVKQGPKRVVSDSDIVKCNIAITNNMRSAQCSAALQLFNSMHRKTSVTWNTMISGYLSNGQFELAREMFDSMPCRDSVSWNVMISGYIKNGNLGAAKCLFDQMPERDVVSWNAILSGYAQNGLVDEAWRIFCEMPVKNEISWNGILAAYVQNGRMEEASRLFESKECWAMVSWNCLMGGYLKKRMFAEARCVFDRMPERDKVSWNTMISCYAQNGEMEVARKLFDESPIRDVFAWTSMVSGYVQNGMLDEARRVFDEMPEKNAISWNAMIAGYVQSKKVDMAWELFNKMPCKNISSWNTMITCYAQNGDTARARSLFDRMPHRDCISWSAIIGGYAQNGDSEEALHMFAEMERHGERMNRSSFTCILSMCADIAALELGKQIHGQVFKAGFESGCYVGNALLAMYCKCGSIEEAYDVFMDISEKDIVSWNTIINGYARHGFGKEALKLFEKMERDGIKPDEVTLVGVLSACSHTGLVETGTNYFYSMTEDYGITANSKHYTCMIDLLGRAGRLDDAQKLMKDMPFEADAATWGALLGASRIHGNAELGEEAAEMIFEMEPWNAGMYVLLSNLYASSGKWREVGKMRLKMRDTGVKKVPGYSWVEVQNKIHIFSVGDSTHPQSHRIYAFLEELDLRMKHEGFVSSPKLVLHDVQEEEKEHMLKYHSEKLAVAFAILNIPAGRPIRVIKNLRVCVDCHTAIKYISKIVGRVIIVRDSNRFHHFRDGVCSCGDYW
ncbi:OLC1v1008535C1 [Oldenlandia corymbosa var. corymbosa]|uniref:OLC1v1008535C1 n=1 Tax=Oldenlandia corymbosa var. corymbosa TaxID=529605 RepID=A0AAV1DQ63_OLDCO|nr:OLC1v1008535C1 [Oldenlandia corymbosa var. corymbosa]